MLNLRKGNFLQIEDKLKDLLSSVRRIMSVDEFCGVGVVVYEDTTTLPVASLCPSAELPKCQTLAEEIALCSLANNVCHDGFQLVSSDWVLLKRNQYFAPFINGASCSNNEAVGARYMAAKHGSLLKSVLCTGLISERDGLLVFVDGEVV
jgi:hypothetical protein